MTESRVMMNRITLIRGLRSLFRLTVLKRSGSGSRLGGARRAFLKVPEAVSNKAGRQGSRGHLNFLASRVRAANRTPDKDDSAKCRRVGAGNTMRIRGGSNGDDD